MYLLGLLICFIVIPASHQQTSVVLGTYNYTSYEEGGALSRIVISAGHGGGLLPSEIANRSSAGCFDSTAGRCTFTVSCGTPDPIKCDTDTRPDSDTQSLAREIADAIKDKFGGTESVRPHVVMSELHRSKMDPNREINEATFGDSRAQTAYNDYHRFINTAITRAMAGGRHALYIDVHGQNQPEGWHMVGFLINETKLATSTLSEEYAAGSSINQVHTDSSRTMEELVRGSTSIGSFLQTAGFSTVPSPVNKDPGSAEYYMGGYSLSRHGRGVGVSGFQIEAHKSVRDISATRVEFAEALADAVYFWMTNYY